MPKFKLTIKRSELHECIVEADSKEAAEDKFWESDTDSEFIEDLGFDVVNIENAEDSAAQ